MMPLPFEKPERTLFVNAGSVNAVPYKMLDGTTSRGQAAVFTVEHGKGHVEFIALGRPRR